MPEGADVWCWHPGPAPRGCRRRLGAWFPVPCHAKLCGAVPSRAVPCPRRCPCTHHASQFGMVSSLVSRDALHARSRSSFLTGRRKGRNGRQGPGLLPPPRPRQLLADKFPPWAPTSRTPGSPPGAAAPCPRPAPRLPSCATSPRSCNGVSCARGTAEPGPAPGPGSSGRRGRQPGAAGEHHATRRQ